jgi:hypothetical protein
MKTHEAIPYHGYQAWEEILQYFGKNFHSPPNQPLIENSHSSASGRISL